MLYVIWLFGEESSSDAWGRSRESQCPRSWAGDVQRREPRGWEELTGPKEGRRAIWKMHSAGAPRGFVNQLLLPLHL